MSVAAFSPPDYRNPSLTIERRTKDLIQRMTYEEKAAQLLCVWNKKLETLLDESGHFDPVKANDHYGHGNGLGQVGRPGDAYGGASPREFAEVTNEIQRFFLENTRLGIPVMFHDECLHGLVAREATSFPQPIALAGTFNPGLIRRVFEIIASEARAVGVHQALTPVLDVARDPRWGRVEETFGEDPFLVAAMGLAAVRGLQGDTPYLEQNRVVCTLKHFAAHGQPESGNNCAPVSISERHLREIFLYPFERAIREGKAQSVMASYNEIDGVPSHANTWLLDAVLRGEWGFKGTIVSDYYAIRELWNRPELYGHQVAANREEAALLALEAGVNIEFPEPDCYEVIPELIQSGEALSVKDLDMLIAPLLKQKFELGLFDNPYTDPQMAESLLGCDEHRQVALEAAYESVTLLKNNRQLLPLKPGSIRTVAVIGPNADRTLLGGYSGKPKHFVTVLKGLRAALGGEVEVLYAPGCDITLGGDWWQDEVTPSLPEEDSRLIAAAVEVAKRADLVVLALGGNEQTCREAWMSNHLGDRTNLNMVGRQDDLVDALFATGKPIVSLLFNGRPLSVGNLVDKSQALLECWYLGQETGVAVADVLLGNREPTGRLPITIPKSVGHLPAYYNHRPSARRGYLFDDVKPLFPFGFGLSYTTFEFGPPALSKSILSKGASTTVRVVVTNTGRRAGTETVQLYVRDCVSSVTRPVIELRGFAKVFLEAGEAATVEIPFGPEHLAFWNIDKEFVVEVGDFEIMTGPNSADLQSCLLTVC